MFLNKSTSDRNFDDLSEKFARKVYGGLKGDIRLAVIWRDLLAALPSPDSDDGAHRPLRILDVGGGLGQISVALAELGHSVVYNDISEQMFMAAHQLASERQVVDKITWQQRPYQALVEVLEAKSFDLVLCHAVIEWLVEPEKLIAGLEFYLKEGGTLSLTFYNENALIYRNLIRGNFKVLESEFSADPGSLTPGTPLQPSTVAQWLERAGLSLQESSGIRVFHDYVTTQRGGHEDPQAVLDMELRYSSEEPFKWLGRYIHFLANKGD